MGTMGLLLVNFTRPALGKAVCFTRAPHPDFGLRWSFYLCVAFLRC